MSVAIDPGATAPGDKAAFDEEFDRPTPEQATRETENRRYEAYEGCFPITYRCAPYSHPIA